MIKINDIKNVKIKDITPNPANRNKHPKDQIERLTKIIQSTGFRTPLIVSNRSGYLVSGHCRLQAAKKLKMTEVPVAYQDFKTEEEEYQFLVADNAVAAWAELDLKGIKLDLNALPAFDLDLLGLKEFNIGQMETEIVNDSNSNPINNDEKCPTCGAIIENN